MKSAAIHLCLIASVSAFGPTVPSVPALPEVPVASCQHAPHPVKPACEKALEQAPADITKGESGKRDPAGTLIVEDYLTAGLCQVNVHWHLGAEHKSQGQYDIEGDDFIANTYQPSRRLLEEAGEIDDHDHGPGVETGEIDDHDVAARPGFMCQGYDPEDAKYTTPYDWQYCEGMQVGLTYEVHWPHSSAGHCGHLSDGLGGIFCTSEAPEKIGVQGQVFVVVNDDNYDEDNLINGMLVNKDSDIAKYTGSSTGTGHDNEICSAYAPISWHVDRACHLVSAKSFDMMCKAMKEQGMKTDLHAHGSRMLVDPEYVSSVTMNRRMRRLLELKNKQ